MEPPKTGINERLPAFRAAAEELERMIASWGIPEEQLVEEYKQIRQAGREKKRKAV